MTNILETFRFDFSNFERDIVRLENLFEKYGYPNLKVDMSDAYDGLWKIKNIRNMSFVWTCYHSGFVTFYSDNGILKICFDSNKSPENKDLEKSTTFFEEVTAIKPNSYVLDYAAKKLGMTVDQLITEANKNIV